MRWDSWKRNAQLLPLSFQITFKSVWSSFNTAFAVSLKNPKEMADSYVRKGSSTDWNVGECIRPGP